MGYVLAVLSQPGLGSRFRGIWRSRWIYFFLGLYALHALALLWTDDFGMGRFILEKKASLFVLPLFIGMDRSLNKRTLRHAMFSLVLSCTIVLFFCLLLAGWRYGQTHDAGRFFYHRLGQPIPQFNAVYYSCYFFTALVFTNHLSATGYEWLSKQWVRSGVSGWLLLGLLLLSSKLFIAMTALYLLALMAHHRFRRATWGWGIGLGALLAGILVFGLTRSRFQELIDSRFEVVQQEQYRWDTPLNGLTLRLVFLKFGWEIIQRENALLTGVGPGDAQQKMNAAIKRRNLYHGNPQLGDSGYLGYNFHHQFMELWVQVGLLGVLLFAGLLLQGLIWGWGFGWRHPFPLLVMTILGFSFIESLLERQHGIVFVTYFLYSFITVFSHERSRSETDAQRNLRSPHSDRAKQLES